MYSLKGLAGSRPLENRDAGEDVGTSYMSVAKPSRLDEKESKFTQYYIVTVISARKTAPHPPHKHSNDPTHLYVPLPPHTYLSSELFVLFLRHGFLPTMFILSPALGCQALIHD